MVIAIGKACGAWAFMDGFFSAILPIDSPFRPTIAGDVKVLLTSFESFLYLLNGKNREENHAF